MTFVVTARCAGKYMSNLLCQVANLNQMALFHSAEQATTLASGLPWPQKRTTHFFHGMATSGLHNYLDKFRKEEYLKHTEEFGWKVLLPLRRREILTRAATIGLAETQALSQQVPFSG